MRVDNKWVIEMEELKEEPKPVKSKKPDIRYSPATIYSSGKKTNKSYVITIPKKQIKEMGWKEGDLLDTAGLKKIGRKVSEVFYEEDLE